MYEATHPLWISTQSQNNIRNQDWSFKASPCCYVLAALHCFSAERGNSFENAAKLFKRLGLCNNVHNLFLKFNQPLQRIESQCQEERMKCWFIPLYWTLFSKIFYKLLFLPPIEYLSLLAVFIDDCSCSYLFIHIYIHHQHSNIQIQTSLVRYLEKNLVK